MIEALLRRNLNEVFGEHDSAARQAAIAEIFTDDCLFIGPAGRHVGRASLNDAVAALQARLPDHIFAEKALKLLDGAGWLDWTFGPTSDPRRITGTDIALLRGNQIVSLLAFVNQ